MELKVIFKINNLVKTEVRKTFRLVEVLYRTSDVKVHSEKFIIPFQKPLNLLIVIKEILVDVDKVKINVK